jgi:psp operon transcriptional activator
MLLANQFAIQMCRELGLPLFPGFSERARETLLGYRWPGNIRELKNVVERSVYRHGTSDSELDNIIINPFHQPLPLQSPPQTLPRIPPGQRCLWICGPSSRNKKNLLQTSLQQAKYNQKQAAALLGLTYHQLRALLKNISCETDAAASGR